MPGKAGIFTENARPRRRNKVEHAFKAKHDVGLVGGRALSKPGKDLQSSGIELGGGARSTLARVIDFDQLAVGTALDERQKETWQRIRVVAGSWNEGPDILTLKRAPEVGRSSGRSDCGLVLKVCQTDRSPPRHPGSSADFQRSLLLTCHGQPLRPIRCSAMSC